jgi:hypothetical protein
MTARIAQCVLILACALHGIDGVADTGKPDAPAATNGDGVATQMPPPNHADNRLTGNESMWGVVGKPAEAILKLANASQLMVSELNDYRDAVDSHKALPFGDLQEDWSGAKMHVLPGGIKQIVISSDVVAESPAAFVGDLSHGLGYFRNYDNDRRLYDMFVGKISQDDPKYRMMVGLVGVAMESRAEVNNYVIQQQIVAATGATATDMVTIKLANDRNAKGVLQSALDNVYASDRAQGVPPERDLAKLEKVAFEVTRTIPIPKRSAQ